MYHLLQPLTAESLKDKFISRFEHLILSGQLTIGQKLPPERELALQLGVSRPVVHEGLVDLAVKGLVTITPRRGATVNDYRRHGSLAMLTSLFRYHEGGLEPELLENALSIRMLFELESARLAARNRTSEHLTALDTLIRIESDLPAGAIERWVTVDFDLHHLVAMASGNRLFPLLLNSFRPLYTNLSARFFADAAVYTDVVSSHRRLQQAIAAGNATRAEDVMRTLLRHGEKHLTHMLRRESLRPQPPAQRKESPS